VLITTNIIQQLAVFHTNIVCHIDCTINIWLNESMALSSKDLEKIENLIDVKLEFRLKPIEARMDTFVTKDEFYTFADKILSEFRTLREEYLFINHRVSDHEERIEFLESKVLT